jgi:hypothetical protein
MYDDDACTVLTYITHYIGLFSKKKFYSQRGKIDNHRVHSFRFIPPSCKPTFIPPANSFALESKTAANKRHQKRAGWIPFSSFFF